MSQEYEDSVDLVSEAVAQKLALSVMFAALTGVLAYVSIPLPFGVPFTLQIFAVFLAGLVLGPVWGGFALFLYLVVGLAGAPVFAFGGSGIAYFVGPTGGFLVGFVLAAIVIGAIAHRSVDPKPLEQVSTVPATLALLVGLVPIYGIGVPWLVFIGGDLTLVEAAVSMAPLFVLDLVKAGIVILLVFGRDELLAQY